MECAYLNVKEIISLNPAAQNRDKEIVPVPSTYVSAHPCGERIIWKKEKSKTWFFLLGQ